MYFQKTVVRFKIGFAKAIAYFLTQTQNNIQKPLDAIATMLQTIRRSKKILANNMIPYRKNWKKNYFHFKKCQKVLKFRTFLQVRAQAVLQKSEPSKKKTVASKRDPILTIKLRALRDEISKSQQIPHFQVFTQETLYAMCDALPRSEKELLKIPGMGKIRVTKYGAEILEAIEEYCLENRN